MIPIAKYYEVPVIEFPVSDTFTLCVVPCVRNGMWMVTYKGKGGSVPDTLKGIFTNKDFACKAVKEHLKNFKTEERTEPVTEDTNVGKSKKGARKS